MGLWQLCSRLRQLQVGDQAGPTGLPSPMQHGWLLLGFLVGFPCSHPSIHLKPSLALPLYVYL